MTVWKHILSARARFQQPASVRIPGYRAEFSCHVRQLRRAPGSRSRLPLPAAGPDIDGVPGPHLGYVSSFILSVSPTKCDAYQVTSCSRQCAAGSSLVPHRPWQPAEDRRTS